ncbi:MAG: hypothetical protein LBG89_03535 [Rickettsiales bacterium]|jgi:hypothetical protein|nr:hypothetical protein [Rickettsiales bacterium]
MRQTILMCAAAAFVVFAAFQAGKWQGRAECEKNAALQLVAAQAGTETIRKQTNDKVNKTAVGDVRRRLREQYTIED